MTPQPLREPSVTSPPCLLRNYLLFWGSPRCGLLLVSEHRGGNKKGAGEKEISVHLKKERSGAEGGRFTEHDGNITTQPPPEKEGIERDLKGEQALSFLKSGPWTRFYSVKQLFKWLYWTPSPSKHPDMHSSAPQKAPDQTGSDSTVPTLPAGAPAALAVCFQAAVKFGDYQLSVTQPARLRAVLPVLQLSVEADRIWSVRS